MPLSSKSSPGLDRTCKKATHRQMADPCCAGAAERIVFQWFGGVGGRGRCGKGACPSRDVLGRTTRLVTLLLVWPRDGSPETQGLAGSGAGDPGPTHPTHRGAGRGDLELRAAERHGDGTPGRGSLVPSAPHAAWARRGSVPAGQAPMRSPRLALGRGPVLHPGREEGHGPHPPPAPAGVCASHGRERGRGPSQVGVRVQAQAPAQARQQHGLQADHAPHQGGHDVCQPGGHLRRARGGGRASHMLQLVLARGRRRGCGACTVARGARVARACEGQKESA